MQAVTEWSLRFLDEHAQLALFVWLLLEESGLPMPIPGDLVILGAGARIGQGRLDWATALVLIEAATLLGSTTLFWLARRGGRPLLLRFGRYLRLDSERLYRSEMFLRHRGFLAVVIGRLTPGLRVVTTVAAGSFGVPYRQFMPASLIGSNNLVLLLAGYFAGPELLRAVEGLRISPWLVGALAGVAALLGVQVLIRRRAHLRAAATDLPEPVRLETALLAGLVATASTVAAQAWVGSVSAWVSCPSPGKPCAMPSMDGASALRTRSLVGLVPTPVGGSQLSGHHDGRIAIRRPIRLVGFASRPARGLALLLECPKHV